MLEVQLLEAGAKPPTVGHPGEDLGYDVFALEDTILPYGEVKLVRTGIAVAAYTYTPKRYLSDRGIIGEYWQNVKVPLGLLIRDRSSMAAKGIVTSGGVIDAGYRGEVKVLMTNWKRRFVSDGDVFGSPENAFIAAGDKIAQMVPVPVLTGEVSIKSSLDEAARGGAGFGSTGS
jgi:dUTP pyrophosphatase